jgi:hypothetical protein
MSQGTGVDPWAAQLPSGVSKRTVAFVVTAVTAYLAALIWAIPASVVMPADAALGNVSGTLWRGSAALADGSRLEWRWAPLRSLVTLTFAADLTLIGAATDLAGRATLGPGSTTFDEVSGGASGAVLAAALPKLPFVCTMPLQVAIDRVRVGGGDQSLAGEIHSGTGLCAPRGGGAATLVPSMVLSLARSGQDSSILLVPAGQRRRTLLRGALAQDGRLHIEVTQDGARTLPFAAPPGGMAIDTQF